MNNNSKLHKISSIFLAAVLVAGVIAIASPSIAFAEEKYEKKYKSYDGYDEMRNSHDPYKEKKHSYDPYKEKKKKHDGSNYDGFKCDANNFNINKVNSKSITRGSGVAEAQELAVPSELTSSQLLDSLFDGGLSIHVKNVCINAGDNSFGGFVGGNGDGNGPPTPETCDDCFETTNNDGPIPPGLLTILNTFLDENQVSLNGVQVDVGNVEGLCDELVRLNIAGTPATADEIRTILEDAWAGQGNAPPVIDRVIECLLALDPPLILNED